MKAIISLIMLFSIAAQAETYICDIDQKDQTISFGLTHELPKVCETDADGEFCWDRAAQFKLSIQTTELPFAEHEEYGLVLEHDVYFQYKSHSSDIEFNMYMDEDEKVEFTLNGESLSFSNCRYYDFNQPAVTLPQ